LIPDAPLSDLANGYGSEDFAVWTGERMLVVQSSIRVTGNEQLVEAASFDPSTSEWTKISSPAPKRCCGPAPSWATSEAKILFALVNGRAVTLGAKS
jgi:hypothetical protein